MEYYFGITLMTIAISIVLIIMTISNDSFLKRKRREFCLGFFVIGIGSVCEFFEIITNTIGIISKLMECLLILIILRIFLKNTIFLGREAQWKNKFQLLAGFIFLIICLVMQIAIPKIKIKWLAIVIFANFVYCSWCSTMQFVDRLTGLLNQRCYYVFWENTQDTNFILIICDLNCFKNINDQYGHAFGDKILIQISLALKETYLKYGRCYRIGGDEFAIIIPNLKVDVDDLRKAFNKKLEEKRKEIPQLPNVAMGYAIYNGDSYATQKEADDNMYKDKNSVSKNL